MTAASRRGEAPSFGPRVRAVPFFRVMLVDRLDRPLRNLRISVTDRCNLRCAYCMPEEDYVWLPRESVLRFEEVSRLVDRFCEVGVDRVRLTGGEPLLRRGVEKLVAMLVAKPKLRDVALTTNGLLLAEQAEGLRAVGLHRLNVSLDTLVPDRFRKLARRDGLERVLEGLAEAARVGFEGIKLDTVLIRGENDDEVVPLVEYAREIGAELRFIEYMDVGGATQWRAEHVVSRGEIVARLADAFGAVDPVAERGSAPAERFRLADGTVVGIIASTTAPFCRSCDRARLTADGHWYRCLYATDGIDLAGPLRAGASSDELRGILAEGWGARADRGAEVRLEAEGRAPWLSQDALRDDPRLEMHTRGG